MINLTPHTIAIRRSDGAQIDIFPEAAPARVQTSEAVDSICPVSGVPIMRRVFGTVVGLPDEGVRCIVSALVLSAVPGRRNVFAPDTGPTAIRNDEGHVIAVTRLIAA